MGKGLPETAKNVYGVFTKHKFVIYVYVGVSTLTNCVYLKPYTHFQSRFRKKISHYTIQKCLTIKSIKPT